MVKVMLKPLDVVEVRGVQVPCNEIVINDILGCPYRYENDIHEIMMVQTFYDNKAWLAPIIGIPTASWLEEGGIIRKKEMNILTRFCFGFINSNLIPS